MRIRELHLKAFGPFSDLRLVLSEEAGPGLTVLYGPNEAGKSSARRAIHDLLYGIPVRSPDDFVHRYAEMRIGARLVFDDGEELAFLRRKGTKKTLRSWDDRTPIESARLLELTERIPEPVFDRFYGLDHRRLTEESRALLADDGDLGRAIFSAGLGVANLRSVLDGLDEEAAALWKPGLRASTPRINRAISEWKKLDAEIRSKSLKPREWDEQEAVVRDLEARREELEAEIARSRTELSRLRRIKRALPGLARRRDCLERLVSMPEVPPLSGDFEARLEALRTDRRSLEFERDRAQRSIEKRKAELAGLVPPRVLLDQEDRIDELYRRIESHREAEQQLPRRESDLDRLEAEIAVSLRSMGLAGEEYLGEIDSEALQGVVRRAVARGNLDERLADEERKWAGLVEANRLAQGRLGLEATPLEKIEALPFPEKVTLELFAARFQKLSVRIERARDEEMRLRGELGEVEAAWADLEETGPVPSEAELRRQRRARDREWRRLRRAWLDGNRAEAGDSEMPADGFRAAADRVETAIVQADEISDRLRTDADRVAQQSNLLARRVRIERELEAVQKESESIGMARATLDREWGEIWRGCEIAPRSPAEMIEWRRGLDRLLENLSGAREMRADLDREIALREAVARDLESALAAFDRPASSLPIGSSTFADLVRAGQGLLDRLEEAARQRERLRETIARRDDLRDRIDKMKANLERFRVDSAALVEACAPDLAVLEPVAASLQLQSRLREAREETVRRAEQDAALQEDTEAFENAKSRLEEIADGLDRLRVEARVSEESEIDSVLRDWKARDEVERALRTIDHALMEIAEGTGIERLESEGRAIDRDDLDRRIEDLEARIERVGRDRDETIARLQSQRDLLDRMDGSEAVSDLAEQAQAKLAEIDRAARRYVEIRLAREILGREIEAYRAANEAPLLKRASALFESLTLGAFVGVGTDYPEPGDPSRSAGSAKGARGGEADQARLVAIREAGAEVPIEGLSSGTRDQLFLALRLAALEEACERGETMPWIADDLLVEFDDPRSRATLDVLARLARKNQILLFSHHAHIADIAREMSGEARLVELA